MKKIVNEKHWYLYQINQVEQNFNLPLMVWKDLFLGLIKKNQFLIGFALETENEIENAKLKIQKKNLDLIVLNSLQDDGAGFGTPTNKVTFIDKNFTIEPMDLKSKGKVAQDILNKVIAYYND